MRRERSREKKTNNVRNNDKTFCNKSMKSLSIKSQIAISLNNRHESFLCARELFFWLLHFSHSTFTMFRHCFY